jgi:hypothetical protein
MSEASPRFRHDLVANAVDEDGVRWVDVRDPRSGASFRFYDFEYELALQMNGQPIDAVVDWATATYGLELTPDGVWEFAGRLTELGFLDTGPPVSSVYGEIVSDAAADESQPVSQVVNRAVSQAVGQAARMSSPGGRRPSQELALVDADWPSAEGSAPRSLAAPTAQRGPQPTDPMAGWTHEVEGAFQPTAMIVREMTAEPAVGDTMMGFAAVKDPPPSTREMTAEPSEQVGTMMGFAAVTDADLRAAEKATARATPAPAGALERRQPPRPEAVVMAPFQDEPRRRAQLPMLPPPPKDRSTAILVLVAVLAVAAAGVGYYLWTQQQGGAESQRVRVIAPRPAAVYRWFETVGAVVAGGPRALSFPTAGVVAEILPAGSRFSAGEILARQQGAAAREADVNRHRSRVAYYEQMRDSMKAAGNQSELRQAELKVTQKKALLDDAERELAPLVIRADEPGEIVEVMGKRGGKIATGAPVVLVRGGSFHGEFALPAKDAEAASHLGFCRVEVVGLAPTASNAKAPRTPPASAADSGPAGGEGAGAPHFTDCKLTGQAAALGAPGKKLEVELGASAAAGASAAGWTAGQPLRLARARYDGVFPIPRAAIVRVGDTDRLYVAAAAQIAEPRAITIADSDAEEVLVSQGIDVGDQVIIDPGPDLRDGTPIKVER